MRTPLWPALAGTVVGRTPVLAITAALFTWIGRTVSDNDDQAAVTLGMLAIVLLVLRTIGRIDWQHRSETGDWRLRDSTDPFVRMTTRLGDQSAAWPDSARSPFAHTIGEDDGADIVEGELLGEEVDDESSSDEDPPAALPPTGAAPA
jgi:hypothetical protein